MSSGTDKINAANELRSFGRKFAACMAIADDLEKLGSFENAAAEAGSRLEALRAEQQAANGAIATAKDAAEKTRQLAADEAARIVGEAKAVKERAEATAKATQHKAENDARDILAKAEAAKRTIEQEIVSLRATRDGANAETEAAVKMRDEINAELAEIANRAQRRKAG